MILHTGTGAIVPVPVVFFRRTYMRKRKGFTLIELLCVLGAMAILCTIAVPVMQQVDERSKDRADDALILIYNQV